MCVTKPAGGRGASVSAFGDLTNQLLSCRVDPRIRLDKNTDTAIVGARWTEAGNTTPCTVNLCKYVSSGVPDQLRVTYGLSEFRCP